MFSCLTKTPKWTSFLLCLCIAFRSVLAFHFAAGTPCTGSGVCSYEYFLDANSSIITVNGFCAPSGICAANGATCTADEQCFHYCGFTSGVCGGLGALCNSQDVSNPQGQVTVTCNTPFTVCSESTQQGLCVLPASSGSRARARTRALAQARSHRDAVDDSTAIKPPRHAVIRRSLSANARGDQSRSTLE